MNALLNPLLALEIVVSGERAPIKQRSKAALQLEAYFKAMPPTPSLYTSFEPYLSVLIEIATAPSKTATKEAQENVTRMLNALASHSPHKFIDWAAQHLHAHAGHEVWFVDWTRALIVASERRIPRVAVASPPPESNRRAAAATASAVTTWHEKTIEFLEFDTALARLCGLWRTVLDYTGEPAAVAQVVQSLAHLLQRDGDGASQWPAALLRKLQPHFVDIADVLVGWAMNTSPRSTLRDEIVSLLDAMRQLWVDNSVFSAQLLASFASDIVALTASTEPLATDDRLRLNTLTVCFLVVARCVPKLALTATGNEPSALARVVRSAAASRHGAYSVFGLSRSADLLLAMASTTAALAPHLLVSVRFLLVQTALLSRSRDCEVDGVSAILNKTLQLLESGADTVRGDAEAVAILQDAVPVGAGKQMHNVRAVQALLACSSLNAPRLLAQLVIVLARVGGADALKSLVSDALRRSAKTRIDARSYNVFCAACFVAAVQFPDARALPRGGSSSNSVLADILKIVAKRWTPSVYASDQRWCFRALLKLSRACLGWFDLVPHDAPTAASLAHDLSISLLRSAVHDVGDATVETLLSERESLELAAFVLTRRKVATPPIARSLLLLVAKKVQSAVRGHDGEARACCVRVLQALAVHTEATALGSTIFDIAMDLVVNLEGSAGDAAVHDVLSRLALSKLVLREPSRRPLHVSKADATNFSATEFATVMAMLGKHESRESEWQRVCWAIEMRSSDSDDAASRNSSSSLLTAPPMLTTIRRASVWCVQSRLRTHFGGPAQTFASIERLLMAYTGATATAPQELHVGASSVVPKALALEFVSALELAIANAADGDADDPDSEAHKTLQFYKANRKVCEDWLSRIRPLLVEIASALPRPELLRHHAYALVTTLARRLTRLAMSLHANAPPSSELLLDVTHCTKDLDSALFALSRSYCVTKDTDSLAGFAAWRDALAATLASRLRAVSRFDVDGTASWDRPLFPWLTAVRLEAEMRYEDAGTAYEAVLSQLLACVPVDAATAERAAGLLESPIQELRMSPDALLGCIQQCAACYAACRDWHKLQRFAAAIVALVSSIEATGISLAGCRGVRECCRVWQHELALLETLELSEYESSAAGLRRWASLDTLGALQSWRVLDGPAQVQPLTLTATDECARVRPELVLLSLQPASLSPVAGESLSKDVECVLLRLAALSPSPVPATAVALDTRATVRTVDGVSMLESTRHDAAVWSQMHFAAPERLPNGATSPAVSASLLLLPHVVSSPSLVDVATLARQQRNFVLASELLDDAAVRACKPHDERAVAFERSQLLSALGRTDESLVLLRELCTSNEGAAGATDVEPLLRLAEACDEPLALDRAAFMTSLAGQLDNVVALDQHEPSATVDQPQDVKGQLLAAATRRGPHSRRAWLLYSDWCYAKATIEMDRIAAQNGYMALDAAEETSLVDHLDALQLDKSDRDAVVRSFLHLMENGSLIAQRFAAFRQQCQLRTSAHVDAAAAIDAIAALQQRCHARALRFHRLAVDGYGQYLAATDDSAMARTGELTTVALRVLRLLTTLGTDRDIADAVDAVFVRGPVAPWRQVVPQLLARAGHPVPAIAALIGKLLVRLARHAPHLVVYPAVVDMVAMTRSVTKRTAADDIASRTLEDVRQALRSAPGELVRGVELLVTELQRISILWDEAWAAMLHKLSTDVARRASTLEKEAARVERNLSLSTDDKTELARRKFVAIMRPVLVSLDRLWADTCGRVRNQSALTPHERRFMHVYGNRIADATQRLRDACDADTTFDARMGLPGPHFVWNPFVDVLKALQSATGRTESLALADISPAMAAIATTRLAIHVPGIGGDSALEPVTVRDVRAAVLVLRTKTKPKCLEFVGSDGRTYKFLLKAREDLRLDERVMQLLRTANAFLRADTASASRDLCTQHYSVLPLSRDSGLIQMVPDVTPMYQVYSNWSSRAPVTPAAVPSSSPPLASSTAPVTAPQQSPTAAFYAKLKQYGVTDVSPHQRPHWPESVLRQVYHDLVAQRPRHVLQHEIARGSGDVRECWSKTARLRKSLAVMSALGYVLGLGDRHLDNILLCNASGDVLHIDYNVCFDKGLKLKVPEIVPFRLTPMLQDALGATGVDGPFRIALEATLRVVRADAARESLLALLDAFVYDPLVDWTRDDDVWHGGATDLKSRLEVNVNLSLFHSRAEERRHDATAFAQQLDTALQELAHSLNAVPPDVAALFSGAAELAAREQQTDTLAAELAGHEDKLAECNMLLTTARLDSDAARARLNDAAVQLAAFASQCLARHRQIVAWKRACTTAPLRAASVLAANANAAASTSFASICTRLVDETPVMRRAALLPRELLASLLAKSQVVDAGVARVQYALEAQLARLRPWLATYTCSREDVDTFAALATGATDSNIYWRWWQHCEDLERVRAADDFDAAQRIVATAAQSPPSLIPSATAIAESAEQLEQLNALTQQLSMQQRTLEAERTALDATWFDQVQRLFASVSALDSSSAESQRLLQLAGTSWLVARTQSLRTDIVVARVDRLSMHQPALSGSVLFRILLGTARASIALVELVAAATTGGMTHSCAADALAAACSESEPHETERDSVLSLRLFLAVLDSVDALVAAVHETEVVGGDRDRTAAGESVALLTHKLAFGASAHELLAVAACGDESTDPSLAKALRASPTFYSALRAASALLAHLNTLETRLGIDSSECDRCDSAASWLELVIAVGRAWASDDRELLHASVDAVASHAHTFLRDSGAALLERALADVMVRDWQFPSAAVAANNADDRAERWREFADAQIAELVASSATLRPNDPHACVRFVDAAVVALMDTCDASCVRAWKLTVTTRWLFTVTAAQRVHRCRLAYAHWFAEHVSMSGLVDNSSGLTQSQVLAALPTFAAELNRLSSDQTALGALVLELAQQLEFLASQASATAQFHGAVQAAYARVTVLGECVRDLADVLQGVGIIETSMGDVAHARSSSGDAALEVDVVGRAVLHAAVDAAQSDCAIQTQLRDKVAARERVCSDAEEKRQALALAVDARDALASRVQQLCERQCDAIAATASAVAERAQRLTSLLRAFDKFKPPATPAVASTPSDAAALSAQVSEELAVPTVKQLSSSTHRRRRSSAKAASKGSATVVPATSAVAETAPPPPIFSFVESERLVKILLRNIKAAEHLRALETVLDKHETNSATLRGVVASLDHALQQFAAELRTTAESSASPSAVSSPLDALTACVATATSSRAQALGLVKALAALNGALVLKPSATDAAPESTDPSTTDSSWNRNLLDLAARLASVCFKLFFDATDMADRLSALEQSASGASDDHGATGDDDDFNVVVHSDAPSAATTGADSDADAGIGAGTSASDDSGSATAAATAGLLHVQAANRHGLQVQRRVAEKLSGHVVVRGDARTLSVAEQANWLVDEATRAENLCVMYEGWTPWI